MTKPRHISISRLPLEPAHGGEGSRRLVLSAGSDVSPHLEAFANTFLPPGGRFTWHKHDHCDEIMVCLSGDGSIEFSSGELFTFGPMDLIYIPKTISHTIICPTASTEFFFIRIAS